MSVSCVDDFHVSPTFLVTVYFLVPMYITVRDDTRTSAVVISDSRIEVGCEIANEMNLPPLSNFGYLPKFAIKSGIFYFFHLRPRITWGSGVA